MVHKFNEHFCRCRMVWIMSLVPGGGREILGVRKQAICLPLQLLRKDGPLLGGESCSFWWAARQGKSWNQSILGAGGNVPAPCSGHFASAMTQNLGLTSAKAFRGKDLWQPTVNHYATQLSQTQRINFFLRSYLLTDLNFLVTFWCCSFQIPHLLKFIFLLLYLVLYTEYKS